jgi:DNA-binding transcriptional MerR regulator
LAHVYKIGAVSQQSGLSVSTLRLWEDQYGLLAPARTAGGTRLYSDADIKRARTIRKLVREQHFSLSAVAEMLEPLAVESPAAAETGVHTILRRLVDAQSGWQAATILVDGITALTGLTDASLGLYRATSETLSFVLTSRLGRSERLARPPVPVRSLPPAWQEAIEARHAYAEDDLRQRELGTNLSARINQGRSRSFHAEPLVMAQRLVGVLVISSPIPSGIVDRARELCERLAVPAGPAVQYFAEQL